MKRMKAIKVGREPAIRRCEKRSFPSICCISILVWAVFFSLTIQAASQEETAMTHYARAVESLRAGKASEAIDQLQQTIVSHERVTDVLALQMGNAHVLEGNAGKAVLWYARALRANRGMVEARQNFGVVTRRTGALAFDDGWPSSLVPFVSPALIAMISALLFWAAFLLPSYRIWVAFRREVTLPSVTRLVVLPLCLVLLSFAVWNLVYLRLLAARSGVPGDAIVISPGTALLAKPDPVSAKLIELPPGSQLKIQSPRAPWDYVEAPGGLRGWVRSGLIETIELADPVPST